MKTKHSNKRDYFDKNQNPKLPIHMKIFYVLGMTSIIMALAGISYFFYLVIYPYEIPQVINPLPLTNGGEYKRGEEFSFYVTYVKKHSIPAVATRTIQCDDGNLVTLTDFTTNLPVTTTPKTIISNPTTIPMKTSLGICKMVMVVTYRFNPIREIAITYETEPFKVIE